MARATLEATAAIRDLGLGRDPRTATVLRSWSMTFEQRRSSPGGSRSLARSKPGRDDLFAPFEDGEGGTFGVVEDSDTSHVSSNAAGCPPATARPIASNSVAYRLSSACVRPVRYTIQPPPEAMGLASRRVAAGPGSYGRRNRAWQHCRRRIRTMVTLAFEDTAERLASTV